MIKVNNRWVVFGVAVDLVGQECNWSLIVETYPDKWVALSDCQYKDGDIASAVLLDVFTEADMANIAKKWQQKGYKPYLTRTTELMGGNVLWLD